MYECNYDIINSEVKVEGLLVQAAEISGATIIKVAFHKFNPHGISGVIVIAESHFTIHTWPEYGYCAVDIFTCGDQIDSEKALHFLKDKLEAKNISILETGRGVLNLPVEKIKHKPDGS